MKKLRLIDFIGRCTTCFEKVLITSVFLLLFWQKEDLITFAWVILGQEKENEYCDKLCACSLFLDLSIITYVSFVPGNCLCRLNRSPTAVFWQTTLKWLLLVFAFPLKLLNSMGEKKRQAGADLSQILISLSKSIGSGKEQ